MEPVFSEIEVVELTRAVSAQVLGGDHEQVTLPAGTKGTVVLVYRPLNSVQAYEVEFYLQSQEKWALATVASDCLAQVSSASGA